MGLCASCDAGKVPATAKVILQDGRLQEYSSPVKASAVLNRDPDSFLCNSDEMEFDDVLHALSAADELQSGQIYFALPLAFLKRPLQAHEMAALAVKASAALVKCDSRSHRRSRIVIAPVGEKDLKSVNRKAVTMNNGGGGRRRRNQVFTVNLDAIAE